MEVIFDANMILRYLLDDNKEMAETAERHIINDSVFVTIEEMAEVVYVLQRVYSMERSTISETLKDFLKLVYSDNRIVLETAIDVFGKNNIDFVDCVLFAYNRANGTKIATFDKKLLKLLNG